MSAKTVLLTALGAVLCATVALMFFRAEQRGSGAEVVSAPEERAAPAQPQPAAAAQEPPPSDRAVAALVSPGPGATRDEQQPAPALLPHQIVPTPMIQALRDATTAAPPGVEVGEFLRSPPPEMLEAEQAFAAEPVDPQWSTPTESSILGKIAQINGLTVVALNVECRTTMCRLQMVQPRGTAPVDLVDTVRLKPRWVISVFNPSGGVTSVAYFMRGEPAAAP